MKKTIKKTKREKKLQKLRRNIVLSFGLSFVCFAIGSYIFYLLTKFYHYAMVLMLVVFYGASFGYFKFGAFCRRLYLEKCKK
jgi:ABC-type Mn2+/Zn2+ transport system permease subunit